MKTRHILLSSLLGLSLAACGHNPKPSSDAHIDTPQGPVQGVSTKTDGIYTFNGLPFAQSPVGDLRWAAPKAPAKWTETRNAAEFGNRCMQLVGTEDGFMNRLIEGQGLGGFKTWMIKRVVASAKPAPISEDCLYLNVRTGNLNSQEKQPVMVWIHGGGHQFGSGDTSFYQANGLVEKDVVLVTINYRLGVFGYMAHPALSADDPNGVSGNYGTLDQMAALKWVRENIGAYGGDPENVTIFGESAGAWSVTELMASPLAKGLFDKAIAQSGASTYHLGQMQGDGVGWPSGYSMGVKLADALGLENPNADDLRSVPANDVISNLPEKADEAFHHIRDGYVFPENVGLAFQKGTFNAVPLMTGFNADEATLFFPDDPEPSVWLEGLPTNDAAAQKAMLETVYPGQAETLQSLYNLTNDFVDSGTQMMGDEIFGVNVRFAAEKNEAQGQPSYTYHFTRVPPSEKQTLGAYHAAEIPFVFGSLEPALGASDEDMKLADLMGTYWTNFAKSGNPNLPVSVPTKWSEFQSQNWLVLTANTNDLLSRTMHNIRQDKLDALEVGLTKKLRDLEASRQQSGLSIGARD